MIRVSRLASFVILEGDVVQLKSGGVPMVAGDLQEGKRKCTWYNGSEQISHGYPDIVLRVMNALERRSHMGVVK